MKSMLENLRLPLRHPTPLASEARERDQGGTQDTVRD